jgi:hypothetical protein
LFLGPAAVLFLCPPTTLYIIARAVERQSAIYTENSGFASPTLIGGIMKLIKFLLSLSYPGKISNSIRQPCAETMEIPVECSRPANPGRTRGHSFYVVTSGTTSAFFNLVGKTLVWIVLSQALDVQWIKCRVNVEKKIVSLL